MVLRQAGLLELCRHNTGSPDVRIALIDTPALSTHPSLCQARIEPFPQVADLHRADARHGTFIASILVGSGGSVLGIAAGCTLLSLPVQDDRFQRFELHPAEVVARVVRAIDHALASQAHVILLSMEFDPDADHAFAPLHAAIERARAQGVCTVISAGNRPRLGVSSTLAVPGALAVSMSGPDAQVHPSSPLSPAVGAGLRGPGVDVPGAIPPGHVIRATGSSFAAAIVCATIALLKSLRPHLSTLQIAAMRPARQTRSLVPPALDAEHWLKLLPSAT